MATEKALREAQKAAKASEAALQAHMAAGEPDDVDEAVAYGLKAHVLAGKHRAAAKVRSDLEDEYAETEKAKEADARSAKLALDRVLASAQAFVGSSDAAHLKMAIDSARANDATDPKMAHALGDLLKAIENVQALAAQ